MSNADPTVAPPVPNAHRGEIPVTLAGRAHVLRPSFQALVEVERRTGRGIVPIIADLLHGRAAIGDVAAVLTAGLHAAGEPATVEAVGDLVFQTGLAAVLPAAIAMLEAGLTGGRPAGEATAERAAP